MTGTAAGSITFVGGYDMQCDTPTHDRRWGGSEPMSKPLTTNQLARLVAADGYDEGLIFRRIRHWTISGLIAVEGEMNPGHGKTRYYSPAIVAKARTLNRLTQVGVAVETLRLVSRMMDSPVYTDAVAKHGPMLLAIKKYADKEDPELKPFYPQFDPPDLADAEYTLVVKLG
jgi:DNA-binding transcriptional MerR regulator